MLSLEQCRKVDPDLKDIPDEELMGVLKVLYEFGNLVMDSYEKKLIPKIPFGSQPDSDNCGTV